jgi:hypothetical protein
MKKLVFILMAFVAFSFTATANDYAINEVAVDQMFNQADEISTVDFSELMTANAPNAQLGAKNAWVAWALTWTAYVGVCGVHRLYLGSSTGVFLVYLCTGGGCGVIQTVDWVLLLMGALDNDVSKYEDNTKVIMWYILLN